MNIVTDSSFNDFISADRLSIVDFWAPWCGPCVAIGPTIDKLAESHLSVNVGKLNVDDNPVSTNTYNIRSIPCIIFFKSGKEVDRVVGGASRAALEKKILEHTEESNN